MLRKSSSLDTTLIGIPWPPSPVVCEIYTLLVFSTSFYPGFIMSIEKFLPLLILKIDWPSFHLYKWLGCEKGSL